MVFIDKLNLCISNNLYGQSPCSSKFKTIKKMQQQNTHKQLQLCSLHTNDFTHDLFCHVFCLSSEKRECFIFSMKVLCWPFCCMLSVLRNTTWRLSRWYSFWWLIALSLHFVKYCTRLTRGSHASLKVFPLYSRPWKYLKTGLVLESPWISVSTSLKVLEFSYLVLL